MSTLTLVRHGQANLASGGLTEIGKRQACALAAYWMRREVCFDEVYTGSLLRHRETEAAVAAAYKDAKRSWSVAQVLPEFDEYDADGVLRALAPATDFNDPRAFQRAFEEAMTQWFAHAGDEPPFESWPRFRDRVRAGLAKIVAGGGNRRVVVFTSGGPVGLLVQTAVAAPERNFLQMNWRVRNTSLTEFLFSGARFTLDVFNTFPHLDPELVTFR
jgi:broad specificity phosphatase PhoE